MFLPDIAEDNLKLLSEDVAMTIYGVMLAIEVRKNWAMAMHLFSSCKMQGCFQCNNLVEQWEKEFYVSSEKVKKYYFDNFPDIETVKPVPIEVNNEFKDILCSKYIGKCIYSDLTS